MTDYHEYLLTPQWQTKRENVLIFWGHRCALCFSDINIEVHHRTYKRLGNELMTDLIALCSDCHSDHHFAARSERTEHISTAAARQARAQ